MPDNKNKINEMLMRAQQFEEGIREQFQRLGWGTPYGQNSSVYDFYLCWQGKTYGGVDCFYCGDVRRIKTFVDRKVAKIKSILEKDKPPIFVMTNGGVFDVYYDGVFMYTLSSPPDPVGFMITRGSVEE